MAGKIKTGDGRDAASEEEFEGPRVGKQVMDMFNVGEIGVDKEEEVIEDLDMGDGFESTTQPIEENPDNDVTVKEEQDVTTPVPQIEDEPSSSDSVNEGSMEEIRNLRAELLAMKELMGDPAAQIPLQPVAPAPEAPQPVAPYAGVIPQIKTPTEEEYAEIQSDPAKFVEFLTESLAIYKQQTLVDITPMLSHQIATHETIKDYFGKEENRDIASGPIRQLVIQYAGQLEAQGQFTGIANTLTRASELVRAKVQIAKAKGPVVIGRKNLQAAQTPTKNPANRFAGGNQTRKAGKGTEEPIDETEDLITTMFNAGGRI